MLTTKSYLIYRSIHIIPIVPSHVQSHIRSLDAYREIDKKLAYGKIHWDAKGMKTICCTLCNTFIVWRKTQQEFNLVELTS